MKGSCGSAATATGRALLERRIVQIEDVRAHRKNNGRKLCGWAISILSWGADGAPGSGDRVLALTRSEVRPFTDKQIELVATFADQAAIAIEMYGCSKVLKPAPANWRSRWKNCAPRKTVWFRPRNLPHSAS